MFPAFAHFRRTATRDAELGGKQIKKGEKVVMWYVSSTATRPATRTRTASTSTATPSTGVRAGGRHLCLGTALARLELRILIEETLRRYPQIALDGEPVAAEALFVNQLKRLPVRLAPAAA